MTDRDTAPKHPGGMAPSPDLTVGMIGLGDMGAAIASAILGKGFPMVVYDLRPEAVDALVAKGARGAASVEALAADCDTAILVVVDDAQVRQVVGQLLARPGSLKSIIVSATVLPGTVSDLAEEAAKQGIALLDAPVTGGAEKASRGIITILVGASAEAMAQCRPVFEAFGANIFHLGPPGAGSAAKLVNNLLSIGGNILLLEAMDLARAYGITEDAVTEFVSTGAGDSRGLRTWGRLDRARRSHTLAGTPEIYEIFAKDVRVAAKAAGARGVTLPVAAGIGMMIGQKFRERDKFLADNDMLGPIPTCRICGQELAAPFRAAGTHPECTSLTPDQACG
ncbi:NAD(P)-dependent oxidoreductase [Sphingobium sp. EM0848]|uniref:NAD(P)-dependent oxidoreductase n=1 Tax=Sphingobium sp. EM0848 TaxID=2743473 RepID=UPI00159BFA29|nr:NAD(P)-dependent oxidoreductase [Sphingobium sp. EM0848]